MDRLMQDQQWQKLILTIQVKWQFPYTKGKGHRCWFQNNLVSSVMPIQHVRHSEVFPQDCSAHVPLLICRNPKEMNHLPTIDFQRQAVSFREGNHFGGALLGSTPDSMECSLLAHLPTFNLLHPPQPRCQTITVHPIVSCMMSIQN